MKKPPTPLKETPRHCKKARGHLKKPNIHCPAAIESSQRTLGQAKRVRAYGTAGGDRQHEVLADLAARRYRRRNVATGGDVGGGGENDLGQARQNWRAAGTIRG